MTPNFSLPPQLRAALHFLEIELVVHHGGVIQGLTRGVGTTLCVEATWADGVRALRRKLLDLLLLSRVNLDYELQLTAWGDPALHAPPPRPLELLRTTRVTLTNLIADLNADAVRTYLEHPWISTNSPTPDTHLVSRSVTILRS